jgi:hypothetical protein
VARRVTKWVLLRMQSLICYCNMCTPCCCVYKALYVVVTVLPLVQRFRFRSEFTSACAANGVQHRMQWPTLAFVAYCHGASQSVIR